MVSDIMHPKKSHTASGPQKYFKNKTGLILLAVTVLIFQVADHVVLWMADRASAANSISYWSQVDIFVCISVLFYVSGQVVKKVQEPSPTPTVPKNHPVPSAKQKSWQPEEKEKAPQKERQSADSVFVKEERRVSFNRFVEKWEPKQKTEPKEKTSSLRADAPSFVSQCTQGLRAEAPSFKSKHLHGNATLLVSQCTASEGLRVEAPEFVPEALSKVEALAEDDIGEVLFSRACWVKTSEKATASTREKATLKSTLQPQPWNQVDDEENTPPKTCVPKVADILNPMEDYNPFAELLNSKSEKAKHQPKWQPKEKIIWKSSHVVA